MCNIVVSNYIKRKLCKINFKNRLKTCSLNQDRSSFHDSRSWSYRDDDLSYSLFYWKLVKLNEIPLQDWGELNDTHLVYNEANIILETFPVRKRKTVFTVKTLTLMYTEDKINGLLPSLNYGAHVNTPRLHLVAINSGDNLSKGRM